MTGARGPGTSWAMRCCTDRRGSACTRRGSGILQASSRGQRTAIFDRTRPHRHFCERGSGSPSSSVRRARKGISSMSCIHPVEMSSRGGRALVVDPSSGWRCALAWTDHSSRRQRRPPSVSLSVDVAQPASQFFTLGCRRAWLILARYLVLHWSCRRVVKESVAQAADEASETPFLLPPCRTARDTRQFGRTNCQGA